MVRERHRKEALLRANRERQIYYVSQYGAIAAVKTVFVQIQSKYLRRLLSPFDHARSNSDSGIAFVAILKPAVAVT
jgi:hypothetical protein